MTNDAFYCSVCNHPVHRHSITKWMQTSKLCRDCPCTGYAPNYRNRGK